MLKAIDHTTEFAEPTTLPALLRLLGVSDEPVGKQWFPIMDWLAGHRLSPRLWMSLLANGYGLQLEQMLRTFDRPVPVRRITTASGTKANMLL